MYQSQMNTSEEEGQGQNYTESLINNQNDIGKCFWYLIYKNTIAYVFTVHSTTTNTYIATYIEDMSFILL